MYHDLYLHHRQKQHFIHGASNLSFGCFDNRLSQYLGTEATYSNVTYTYFLATATGPDSRA